MTEPRDGKAPTPTTSAAASLFGRTLSRLEDNLTAAMIANPLEWRSPSDDARETAHWMQRRGYSQVVVRNGEGTRPLIASLADLLNVDGGPLRAVAKPIDPEAIITHDTGIKRLLGMFAQRPYYFTLRHAELDGIVAVSDLDKLPTRVLLFVHIAELEARLADAIQRCYPNDGWTSHLSAGRMAKVKQMYQQKLARDLQTSRIHCTQFCDKGALALKLPLVRAMLGEGSTREWDRRFVQMQDLRNVIAHGESMISNESDVADLAKLVAEMDGMIRRLTEV